MTTLKIIIERSENMFSAYVENAEGIYGGGDSVKEAKQSILDAIAIIHCRGVHCREYDMQLNGKVERSHLTDKYEFYLLLSYTDNVDLNAKMKEWENFYRSRGVFKGKTTYEALKK